MTIPLMGESGYLRHERDAYDTPAWVTQLLLVHWRPDPSWWVWEPAAGCGKMSSVLTYSGLPVYESDIEPRAEGIDRLDYLTAETYSGPHAVITNPAFEVADEFLWRGLRSMRLHGEGAIALLLPGDWDNASSRAEMVAHPTFAMEIKLQKRIVWIEGSKGHPRKWHSWLIWDSRHDPAAGPALRYGR